MRDDIHFLVNGFEVFASFTEDKNDAAMQQAQQALLHAFVNHTDIANHADMRDNRDGEKVDT